MRKILWALVGVVLIALAYYLIIRPYEFEVRFKARTLPGDLIETIRIWDRSLDSTKVIEVDSFSRLTQSVVWKKSNYIYNWHFIAINDSVTKVKVRISEPSRRLRNKLLILFTEQAIERDANDMVNEFYKILKIHLEITAVKLIGEVELGPSFCVCRSLETTQIEKAEGMMSDYPLLTSFVNDFKLIPDGPPIVRLKEWNHSLGLLKFDFCFPIKFMDSLPLAESVTYTEFKRVRALKAEYYGNYITSDRAWYELIHYAKRKGYAISGLPIEHFHNNPNLGMNEREWKADVYLPIED
jgi:hypothetical protein